MRKVKEYDRQMKSEQKESAELADAQQRDKVDKFMKIEKGVVLAYKRPGDAAAKKEDKPTASSQPIQDPDKQINNFWIPTNTPEAKQSKLKRPDTNIYCPITGQVLKAKDLVAVKFTLIDPEDSEKNLHSKKVGLFRVLFRWLSCC